MEVNQAWDADLILVSMEQGRTEYDANSNRDYVLSIILRFEFYQLDYTVFLSIQDAMCDDYGSVTMEGPSKLFDSMEQMMQDDYWPSLQEAYKTYVKYYDKRNGQPELANVFDTYSEFLNSIEGNESEATNG